MLGLAVGLTLLPWIICNAWNIIYTLGPIQYGLEPVTSAVACLAAIGTVTLDSRSAIESARVAYDSLNDMGKGYVKNYDTLVAAETSYGELVAQQQASEAQAQAKKQAQSVIDAINAIGEVTLEKQKAIEAARKQYNGLSEAARGYVTNLNVLTAAEARLAELLAAQ